MATPVNNDQSCPDTSGQRASQRALPTEYTVHDSSAPTAHSRPTRRRPVLACTCEDAIAAQPISTTPATHSASAGASFDSGTAPGSRAAVTATSTGTMPTISDAAAPPLHCTETDSNT